MVDHMTQDSKSRFAQRYKKLTAGICELVEDFGLVHFLPLAIEDKELVGRVLTEVDKANGYAWAHPPGHEPYPEFSYGAAEPLPPGAMASITEKYTNC